MKLSIWGEFVLKLFSAFGGTSQVMIMWKISIIDLSLPKDELNIKNTTRWSLGSAAGWLSFWCSTQSGKKAIRLPRKTVHSVQKLYEITGTPSKKVFQLTPKRLYGAVWWYKVFRANRTTFFPEHRVSAFGRHRSLIHVYHIIIWRVPPMAEKSFKKTSPQTDKFIEYI